MDRRTELRRERDTELETMAENAMDRADAAFSKWESHEAICAERYRRLDETISSMAKGLDALAAGTSNAIGKVSGTTSKIVVTAFAVLLAVTGALAMTLLNLVLTRSP